MNQRNTLAALIALFFNVERTKPHPRIKQQAWHVVVEARRDHFARFVLVERDPHHGGDHEAPYPSGPGLRCDDDVAQRTAAAKGAVREIGKAYHLTVHFDDGRVMTRLKRFTEL